ncbi:hypothetical protein [Mucilaginibacter sp.]
MYLFLSCFSHSSLNPIAAYTGLAINASRSISACLPAGRDSGAADVESTTFVFQTKSPYITIRAFT